MESPKDVLFSLLFLLRVPFNYYWYVRTTTNLRTHTSHLLNMQMYCTDMMLDKGTGDKTKPRELLFLPRVYWWASTWIPSANRSSSRRVAVEWRELIKTMQLSGWPGMQFTHNALGMVFNRRRETKGNYSSVGGSEVNWLWKWPFGDVNGRQIWPKCVWDQKWDRRMNLVQETNLG